MIDNGSGSVEVRLFTLKGGASTTPVPPNATGVFFQDSCYAVLYKYDESVRGRIIKKFVLYFWCGLTCKNSDVIFAKFSMGFYQMLLNRVGPYRISAMRVRQGKEPKHFLRLFNGRVVYKQGAHSSFSKHLTTKGLYDIHIYSHIVGYPKVHITEVDKNFNSLSSSRCFILYTSEEIYIWVGKNTYPEEKVLANDICSFISESTYHDIIASDPIILNQDDINSDDFKSFENHLNGSINDITNQTQSTARLYCITNQAGYLELFEIMDYSQQDLLTCQSSMLLLHTKDKLYLWEGIYATPSLSKKAMEIAELWSEEFKELKDLDKKQEIEINLQGLEELEFKGYFPGWQNNYVRDFDGVTRKQQENYQRLTMELNDIRELQGQYNSLQDQVELLELISSSPDYSKAEEKAINPEFEIVKVSFDKELIELGLKKAPPIPKEDKLEKFKESIKPGEILFHWKSPALAVALKGSWNNWEQIPMVSLGNQGFVKKLSLDPGRYYYKYLVASSNGAEVLTDEDHPTACINVDDGEKENVNILRVYLCTHPTYLEKQRKIKEDEEEAKKRAEEEANKDLSVEEIQRRRKEWKEHQRIANEERLKRQLEEKRKNRRTNLLSTPSEDKIDISSTKTEEEEEIRYPSTSKSDARRVRKSILDEPVRRTSSIRSSRYSSSPKSDVAYSKTLLSNISSTRKASPSKSYKPSTEISSVSAEDAKSYREKRRAELGLGTKTSTSKTRDTSSTRSNYTSSSSTTKTDSPTSRTSSLLDRIDEKLDTASRSSTRSSTSSTRSSDILSTKPSRAPISSTYVPRTTTRTTSTDRLSSPVDRTSTRTSTTTDRSSRISRISSSPVKEEPVKTTPSTRIESPTTSTRSRASRISTDTAPPTSSTTGESERERKRRERRKALGLE